jgi:hypothetical protein
MHFTIGEVVVDVVVDDDNFELPLSQFLPGLNLLRSPAGIASSISSTVMATGIARRAYSLKKQWPADRDITVLRQRVIEVAK